MEDYYQILGVPPNAPLDEIKARFRLLATAYHPDKFGNSSLKARAEEEFKRINAAYQVLSDPTKRVEYDRRRPARAPSSEEETRHAREQQAEAERRRTEYERQRRERAEAEWRRAERERQEREQAEAERLRAERAEAERRRAEHERQQREQAEAERLCAERAEAERRRAEHQRQQRALDRLLWAAAAVLLLVALIPAKRPAPVFVPPPRPPHARHDLMKVTKVTFCEGEFANDRATCQPDVPHLGVLFHYEDEGGNPEHVNIHYYRDGDFLGATETEHIRLGNGIGLVRGNYLASRNSGQTSGGGLLPGTYETVLLTWAEVERGVWGSKERGRGRIVVGPDKTQQSGTAAAPPTALEDQGVSQSLNFNGTWRVMQRTHPDISPAGEVRVDHQGERIVATRTMGNKYIPAGQVSLRATVRPGQLLGAGKVLCADEGFRNPNWIDVQIEVTDRNTIVLRGSGLEWWWVMRRIE